MYSYPSKGPVHSRISYWRRYPYKPRLAWGLFYGWFSATALTLYVVALALAGRTTHFEPAGASLGSIVLGYWIAGTILGLVLAVAYPLTRSRFGAFILGFFLGWLVYATIWVVTRGFETSALLICLIPGLIVGGGLGVVFFDEAHPPLDAAS